MELNLSVLAIALPLILVFIVGLIIAIFSYKVYKNTSLIEDKTQRLNGFSLKNNFPKILKKYPNDYMFFAQVDQLDNISHLYGMHFYDDIVKQLSLALENYFETDRIYYLGNAKFIIIIDEKTKSAYSDKNFVSYLDNSMAIKYYQKVLRYRLSLTKLSPSKDYKEVLKELYLAANIYQDEALNQCVFYHEDLSNNQTKVHRIVETLITVANQPTDNHLFLHYQPIIDVRKNKIQGFEVLSRLTIEEYGSIEPDKFITIAERYGVIPHLGKRIIEKSFEDFKKILAIDDKQFISINLSPLQLKDSSFPSYLEALVKKYHYHPAQIHLEITETAFAKNYNDFLATVKTLKELGFKIYLDDFGVGYSSFQYMIDAAINGVKLDRYFTEKISKEVGYDMFSQGLAFMVKGLNGSITIEGIEHKSQAEYFRRLGADYFQGYLFSKPKPLDEALKMLKKMS
ncbi:MAG: EAL domain-containing protein [Candidatus Izemoplasmataceae bacterium]